MIFDNRSKCCLHWIIGRHTGYAYEYQERIAAYTGWEYELIIGEDNGKRGTTERYNTGCCI
jgi:hypothetical protein